MVLDGEYNSKIYASLIAIGIIFYVVALAFVFDMVSAFQNDVIPVLNSLISTKYSYRIVNATITSDDNGAFLKLRVLLNITFAKKVDKPGPQLSIIYHNETLASINISTLNKDIVNYPLDLKINILHARPSDNISLFLFIKTKLFSIKTPIGKTNVSELIKNVEINVSDVKSIENLNGTTTIKCKISSNIPITAPLQIVFYDKNGALIYKTMLRDFNVSPGKPYSCSTTVPDNILIKTSKVAIRIGNLTLREYQLQGGIIG